MMTLRLAILAALMLGGCERIRLLSRDGVDDTRRFGDLARSRSCPLVRS
jgi:hypothetical protein